MRNSSKWLRDFTVYTICTVIGWISFSLSLHRTQDHVVIISNRFENIKVSLITQIKSQTCSYFTSIGDLNMHQFGRDVGVLSQTLKIYLRHQNSAKSRVVLACLNIKRVYLWNDSTSCRNFSQTPITRSTLLFRKVKVFSFKSWRLFCFRKFISECWPSFGSCC